MAFKRSAVRSRLSPPGRLAQLVAHPLDVREVTSSSLVSSTIDSSLKSDESFLFPAFFAAFASQKFGALIVLSRRTPTDFLSLHFCELFWHFRLFVFFTFYDIRFWLVSCVIEVSV